jgi:hypothetical protein
LDSFVLRECTKVSEVFGLFCFYCRWILPAFLDFLMSADQERHHVIGKSGRVAGPLALFGLGSEQ